jgi:hypothetical protein
MIASSSLVRVARQPESNAAMSDSKTDSEIAFTIRLTKEDWDATLGAWRCPALAIPKAEIGNLFVGGSRVDKANYEVLKGPAAVRWIAGNPPAQVAAQIRLSEELSLESETGRWKKLAVVLPVVASIVAALIGAAATYLSKSGANGPNTTDLVKAHFNDWNFDKDLKIISYRLTVESVDSTEYVKKADKDKYRFVVGVRPRAGISDMDGQYDYALEFPFESTLKLAPPLDDDLRQAVATGCVSLILFRVSAVGLARIRFKTPFVPAHYGPEIKKLEGEYDGAC